MTEIDFAKGALYRDPHSRKGWDKVSWGGGLPF